MNYMKTKQFVFLCFLMILYLIFYLYTGRYDGQMKNKSCWKCYYHEYFLGFSIKKTALEIRFIGLEKSRDVEVEYKGYMEDNFRHGKCDILSNNFMHVELEGGESFNLYRHSDGLMYKKMPLDTKAEILEGDNVFEPVDNDSLLKVRKRMGGFVITPETRWGSRWGQSGMPLT